MFAKVNKDAINQVKNATNQTQQKMYYLLLSQEEKQYIWLERLRKIESAPEFTTIQKLFISKVISHLKPQLFEASIGIENEQTIAVLRKESIMLFGKKTAGEIFATVPVDRKNSESVNQREVYPPGTGDCDCNKSDDWCQGVDQCVREGCKERSSGCGWFLLQPCNGDCWPVP